MFHQHVAQRNVAVGVLGLVHVGQRGGNASQQPELRQRRLQPFRPQFGSAETK
jgi:hypothetical protein